MTIQLSEKQALAMKTRAAPLLKKLNIKSFDQYEPHKLAWSDLNSHRGEILKTGRSIHDAIKDDITDEEAARVEEVHDGLMVLVDAIDSERDIRSEIGNRSPRKTSLSPRVPAPGDKRVRADGDDLEDATEAPVSLRKDESMAEWLLENRRDSIAESRGLSLGGLMRAMVLGPRTDAERRTLSEGTDSAGGYTVPDILSARFIDRLRAASTVMRAGAQTIPLGSDVNYIAKLLTDPTPAWRNENAAIAESDPTFGRVTLTARSLGVIVKVSRELLEDSLNIGSALPDVIATAMAAELDRVALLGTGTPPEPKGIANFSGLTSSVTGAGPLNGYYQLMLLRQSLMGANVDVSHYIMSARDKGRLDMLLDGDGNYLVPPPAIANVPILHTSKIPTNLGGGTESKVFAGDFSKLLIGIRHQIRIEILKERYADNNQYAFVAVMRADVAAEHEAAFAVWSGVTP